MKEGDDVMTPHGPAKIIAIHPHGEWVFGRHRPTPWAVIQYPNGQRHAWVIGKLRPIRKGADDASAESEGRLSLRPHGQGLSREGSEGDGGQAGPRDQGESGEG